MKLKDLYNSVEVQLRELQNPSIQQGDLKALEDLDFKNFCKKFTQAHQKVPFGEIIS
jgi:hypothetical protein